MIKIAANEICSNTPSDSHQMFHKRIPKENSNNNNNIMLSIYLLQPINANDLVMGIILFIKSFLCLFFTSKDHTAPLTILVSGKSHSSVKPCAYSTLMCIILHLVAFSGFL